MSATTISTSGYIGEIGSRHPAHRPRKRSQPRMGTFSCHRTGRPQPGQCDGGEMTDWSCGHRETHTFRKEPTTAPNTNAKMRAVVSVTDGSGEEGCRRR